MGARLDEGGDWDAGEVEIEGCRGRDPEIGDF